MHAKIKKKIRFSVQSHRAWLAEIKGQLVLPNKFAQAVGPFIFLEHVLSYKQSANGFNKGLVGRRSHPHRGIAMLAYILAGEVECSDSLGNHSKQSSGGLHWTKAGKGIIHDEAVSSEFQVANPDISVVRFWINLPSIHKSEEPDCFSIQSGEIPNQELDDSAGWVKILLGKYGNVIAKVPSFSKEFLYHVHLRPGRRFWMTTDNAIEYAAFLPSDLAEINDIEIGSGKLVLFTSQGEIIEIHNQNQAAIDILLFGGEAYKEPIVAEEAFVMNTPHEITQAYNDFYEGKYGHIKTFKNNHS
jgi:redox-sensitive bicupin YhaK (pirin superfamily)